MGKRILIIGNGYIADNFVFTIKDTYDTTVYARNKYLEYDNVTYIYDSIEHIGSIQNNFDAIYILFGHSRPNKTSTLSDVIYSNVYLTCKILEFAVKNNSKIFYPATSLALSDVTKNSSNYSYSHTIVTNMIKRSGLDYTICYLHNVYGSLTGADKKNKMVIDNFIDCYHSKQSAKLINNGQQRRIFTHISDVVTYMKDSIDYHRGEVNLVKNNTMYSIKELAELLELHTDNVQDVLYSLDDPYLLPIDDVGTWYEQIDIKDWIINKVKI